MPASEERCLAERGVAERAFEDYYGVAATNPACVWRGVVVELNPLWRQRFPFKGDQQAVKRQHKPIRQADKLNKRVPGGIASLPACLQHAKLSQSARARTAGNTYSITSNTQRLVRWIPLAAARSGATTGA